MRVGRKDYTGDQATKETKGPSYQGTKGPGRRRVAVLEGSHGPLVPWFPGPVDLLRGFVFRLAWSLGRLVPWSFSVGAWRSGSRRASAPQGPPLRQGPQRRR